MIVKKAPRDDAIDFGELRDPGCGLNLGHAVIEADLRDPQLRTINVTERLQSAHALREVPIAITVENAQGSTVFQNNAPGLEAALTSLGSLPAHGVVTWVDDQVPATGNPVSVTAIAGVSPAVSGAIPEIEVAGVHPSEESASATAAGIVRNRSSVTQHALVVYAVARRAGRVVAAGRAILPEVTSGTAAQFQAYLVGSPHGATLQVEAPAATFG